MPRFVPVLVIPVLALFACNANDGTSVATTATAGTSTTSPTSGVGTGTAPVTTSAQVVSASCAVSSDNSLRVWCDATLVASGTATVQMSAVGAPTRSFAAEASGVEIRLFAWGLKPNTTYDWMIGDAAGTVTTGALPADLTEATVSVSGAIDGFDAVMQPIDCNDQYFVAVDSDGDFIWYEQNSLYQNGMNGYEWSQEARSLSIASASTFVEIEVTGDTLLSLNQGADFSGDLHHDLGNWGDYRYLLFDRTVNGLAVDGFYVFDGSTLMGTFALEDHYTVTGGGGPGPGGNDWSHANGINITDDGDLILSLLQFDSVLSIDADPSSGTFLDINWVVDGSGNGLPGADYTAPSGADEGFSGQHNASFHADGLWLYDNDGSGDGSRAAHYELDLTAGQVLHVESWDMGEICSIEGGAVPIGNGTVLATCATARDIKQYASGSTDPIFSLNASCGDGGGAGPGGGEAMNRGIPIVVE
jgi:hypothetical protein